MTYQIDGQTVVGFDPIVIKGDKGDPGPQGPSGPQGPAGPQGPSGTGAVTSVNAHTGVVTLTAADVGAAATANNLSDLSSAATARTNLGLGSAATQNTSAFDAAGAATTAQNASLQKTSNLSDLNNAATARTNLGLGTAATQNSTAFDAAGAAATAQTAAQAYADANKIPLPSPAAGPGQLFGTDGSGNVAALDNLLAYAEDLSNVATVLNTGGAESDVIGVAITVPATPRFVSLRFNAAVQITAAGAGAIYCAVYETTSGASVALNSMSITGGFTTGTGSQFPTFGAGEIPLGPIASPRTFKLAGVLSRDASSTLAASFRSGASGAPFSWLKAVAE